MGISMNMPRLSRDQRQHAPTNAIERGLSLHLLMRWFIVVKNFNKMPIVGLFYFELLQVSFAFEYTCMLQETVLLKKLHVD